MPFLFSFYKAVRAAGQSRSWFIYAPKQNKTACKISRAWWGQSFIYLLFDYLTAIVFPVVASLHPTTLLYQFFFWFQLSFRVSFTHHVTIEHQEVFEVIGLKVRFLGQQTKQKQKRTFTQASFPCSCRMPLYLISMFISKKEYSISSGSPYVLLAGIS